MRESVMNIRSIGCDEKSCVKLSLLISLFNPTTRSRLRSFIQPHRRPPPQAAAVSSIPNISLLPPK
jgi:hypothetical protein